jgi:hypothetical protein
MNGKVALFSFNPNELNWKFKIKKGARRLKLYIKMDKSETEQWDAVKSSAKPPEMSDDEFARILFYKGIHSFMQELAEHVNNMSEEEREAVLAGADGPVEAEVSEDQTDE